MSKKYILIMISACTVATMTFSMNHKVLTTREREQRLELLWQHYAYYPNYTYKESGKMLNESITSPFKNPAPTPEQYKKLAQEQFYIDTLARSMLRLQQLTGPDQATTPDNRKQLPYYAAMVLSQTYDELRARL